MVMAAKSLIGRAPEGQAPRLPTPLPHHNALLTPANKITNCPAMKTRHVVTAIVILTALAACGDSSKKQVTTRSQPVLVACTTPEQAGLKAADITRRLVEEKKAGTISADQYTAFNNTMSAGLQAWADRQDLKAYCAALDRVVKDAALN